MGETLDKEIFFRANRNYIVNAEHVTKIKKISKNKITVGLSLPLKREIIVSPENATAFKTWMTDGK